MLRTKRASPPKPNRNVTRSKAPVAALCTRPPVADPLRYVHLCEAGGTEHGPERVKLVDRGFAPISRAGIRAAVLGGQYVFALKAREQAVSV